MMNEKIILRLGKIGLFALYGISGYVCLIYGDYVKFFLFTALMAWLSLMIRKYAQ